MSEYVTLDPFLEKYATVLVSAMKKLESVELPNLRIINMDALKLNDVFVEEINTIYLNFSDPWPKKRHAKRRLTSHIFLSLYDKVFIGNPHIIQKTDNIGLFAYSLESLSKNGYTLNRVSLDLASEDIDNVITEYENKFISMGIKINYLDAKKTTNN